MNKDHIALGLTIDNLALEVQSQADRLFPNRTDDQMFRKLWSEIGEFSENPTEEEFADVMIMLLDYASRKFWSTELAIRRKMLINDKRRWAVTEQGVFKHVK